MSGIQGEETRDLKRYIFGPEKSMVGSDECPNLGAPAYFQGENDDSFREGIQ